MKTRILFVILIFFLSIFSSCFNKNNSKQAKINNSSLTIYAAAGTRFATDEICDLFEKKNNIKVNRNYTSSGTLARQIANGADCDVYISANKQWVDFLIEKVIIMEESVHVIGGNSLVVIKSIDSDVKKPVFDKDFDILSIIPDKIALGDPAYVPVGKYAKMVLDNFGWYDLINEKGKMILCKDVASVLHYVQKGECDWGIVYISEVIQPVKVDIMARIPMDLHEPIVFYVADLKVQKIKAKELSRIFTEKPGQKILKKYGFQVP